MFKILKDMNFTKLFVQLQSTNDGDNHLPDGTLKALKHFRKTSLTDIILISLFDIANLRHNSP